MKTTNDPEIIIRDNQCKPPCFASPTPCCLCGEARQIPPEGPCLCVNTPDFAFVCDDCGRKHAPELFMAVRMFYEALYGELPLPEGLFSEGAA